MKHLPNKSAAHERRDRGVVFISGITGAASVSRFVGHSDYMHRYRVRPGYGSNKLLVEFMSDSSDEAFLAALRSVFSANGITAKKNEDLILLFRTVMDSPVGPFELDHDEWSMVWLHADDNQDVIPYLDRILAESGQFEKEAVDFSEYSRAQPSSRANGSQPSGR